MMILTFKPKSRFTSIMSIIFTVTFLLFFVVSNKGWCSDSVSKKIGESRAEPLTLRDGLGMSAGYDYYWKKERKEGKELVRKKMDKRYRLIAEMGMRHARFDGIFQVVWPSPNLLRWECTDQLINICEKYGIEPLITLAYGTPWASTAPPEKQRNWDLVSYPPDLDAYVRWVRKFATRYKGRIKAYEIWNEPNGTNLFWKGSPRQYATMMKAAYVTIKAVDPEAIVMMATAAVDYSYIRNLYFNFGGDKYCDAVGIHPYHISESDYPDALEVGRKLASKCKRPKQFWNTERGTDTNCESAIPNTLWYIILSHINGFDRNYLFDMGENKKYTFVDPKTHEPRPVYYAVKNLLKKIGDMPLVGIIKSKEGVNIAAYGKMGRQKASLVIWTSGSPCSISLPELGRSTIQIDGTPKVFPLATLQARRLTKIVRTKKLLPPPVVELAGFIEPPFEKLYFKQDDASEQIIKLRVFNNTPAKVGAVVSVKVPGGWKVSPEKISVPLDGYKSKWLEFRLALTNRSAGVGDVSGFVIKSKLGKTHLSDEKIRVVVSSALKVSFQPESMKIGPKGLLTLPVVLKNKSMETVSASLVLLSSHALSWNPGRSKIAIIEPGKQLIAQIEADINLKTFTYPSKVMAWLGDGSAREAISFIPDFPFVLKTDKAITIDGDLKEWRTIPGIYVGLKKQLAPAMGFAWNGPNDASCAVKALWDKKNLYLAFDITDDVVKNNTSGVNGWQKDCIELFLSMKNRQNGKGNRISYAEGDYQIILPALLGPTGGESEGWYDVRHIGGQAEGLVKKGALRNLKTAVKRRAKGYVMEVRIPWDNFPDFKVQPNAEFGFDVGLDDADMVMRKTQIFWKSRPDACVNVARFGTLKLIDKIKTTDGPQVFAYSLDEGALTWWCHAKIEKSVETENIKEGSGALRFDISNVKGPGWVEILLSSSKDVNLWGGIPKHLSLWIYNDMNINSGFYIRLKDRYGEAHQQSFRVPKEKGWHKLERRLKWNYVSSWAGDENKKIDLPLSEMTLTFSYADKKTKGTLIFDDVRIQLK